MRPGQLLAGGDRSFLEQVLEEALAAPADDRTAAQLAAEALIALAGDGADEAVAGHLMGPTSGYEVRVLAIGELTPRESVAGLQAADAVRCFAAADAAREDGLTVELLSTDDGEERVLLVRRSNEVPRLVVRDEARAATIAARRRAIGTDQGDPVVVLAEVLAHLPTPEDIAVAVRAALSEMTVEVDADSIRRAADDAPSAPALPALPELAETIADAVRDRLAFDERIGEQLETIAQAWALLDRRFDAAEAASQEGREVLRDGFEAQLQAVAKVWGALDGRLQEQDRQRAEQAASVTARLDRHDEVAAEQSSALGAHVVALGRLVAQHTTAVDRQLLAEARTSARHRAGVEERLDGLAAAVADVGARTPELLDRFRSIETSLAEAMASVSDQAERRDAALAAEHRWLRDRLDDLLGALRAELEQTSAARDAELTGLATRLVELEADRAELHDKLERVQGALRRIIG